MPQIVQVTAPGEVGLVETDPAPLVTGAVRVATWYSGISAGTELPGEPSFPYPVQGWGYSEVGQIVEVADDVTDLAPGDTVHGIWGHRSDAVLPASALAARVMPAEADQPRLVRTVMGLILAGAVDAAALLTDVVAAADVADIFARLDAGDPGILQAVLRFDAAPQR